MEKMRPIWYEDGKAKIVDQRYLPAETRVLEVNTLDEMTHYIKTLAVRGAPCIGNSAAFGVYLGVKGRKFDTHNEFEEHFKYVIDEITSSRPTAVNLFWAANQMEQAVIEADVTDPGEYEQILLKKALEILQDDIDSCHSIGLYGYELLKNKKNILTHCNAGAMATSEYGTALAPLYVKKEKNDEFKVYADETRPLFQGARITSWELAKSDIDVTVITDSTAGYLMKQGKIDAIIVGADRIAVNGDTANKIGTYTLSVLAKEHKIPFYIAAPLTTVDFNIQTGKEIPIEERDRSELSEYGEKKIVPDEAKILNLAFDVTPHENIDAIITDYGIAEKPFSESLFKLKSQGSILKEGD